MWLRDTSSDPSPCSLSLSVLIDRRGTAEDDDGRPRFALQLGLGDDEGLGSQIIWPEAKFNWAVNFFDGCCSCFTVEGCDFWVVRGEVEVEVAEEDEAVDRQEPGDNASWPFLLPFVVNDVLKRESVSMGMRSGHFRVDDCHRPMSALIMCEGEAFRCVLIQRTRHCLTHFAQ